MARIVSPEEVAPDRVQKTGRSGLPYWRTSFITPQGDDDPQAYMIENSPSMTIASHFHDVDQFQIFVKGVGSIGQSPVQPFSVHYARAFTTYGPIESRGDGLGWMTLRPRRDLGAKMIDTHREVLMQETGRQPWQRTVPYQAASPAMQQGTPTRLLEGERGLQAVALRIGPGQSVLASDPSATPCQYILVTGGTLLHEGRERGVLTVIHVPPTDAPFRLAAGKDGLECLVLDFPHPLRAGVPAADAASASAAEAQGDAAATWHCELCGFVYDAAEGLPGHGIAPGTAWQDVPEDFHCPDCAATKKDFTPLSF